MRKLIFIFILFVTCFTFVNSSIVLKGYTKDELSESQIFEKNIEHLDLGYNYYLKDIEFFGESFVVFGYCYIEKSDDSVYYPYVAYYKNDKLIWYKIETKIENGLFSSCVLVNDKIYLCGEYGEYKKGSIIYSYALDGTLYNNQIYNGNRDLSFKKLYVDNSIIYVVGETNSGDILYKKSAFMEAFIYEFNNNLEIVDATYFGNYGNNEYIDSVLLNDEIVFIIRVEGDGYFEYNQNKPYILLSGSLRMELSMYEKLELGGRLSLRTDGKNLYVLEFDVLKNSIFCYEYDEVLNYKSVSLLKSMPSENYIYYYDLEFDLETKDKVIVGTYRDKDKVVNEYTIKNMKNEIISDFKCYTNTEKSLHKTRLYKGFIYDVGGIIGSNYNSILLAKKAQIIMKDEDLYVNGGLAEKENLTLDIAKYGYYDLEVTYTFNGEKFAISGKYLVPLIINIEKNSKYNKGLVLKFNGIGKLNGELIESGKTVDEVGNYVLEIYGEEVVSYYHFTVDDLVLTDQESIYNELKNTNYTMNNNTNNNLNSNNNSSSNIMNYDDLILDYTYLIIIFVIGFIISIIPFKKIFRLIRSKNNA